LPWALFCVGEQLASGGAVLVAGVGLLVLTAVFDNVMIAVGLFGYRPGTLSGLSVGLAPIEDFAYPVVAAVLLPALWRRIRGPEAEKRPA
jgi:lycopene cyclase domain-containing protein